MLVGGYSRSNDDDDRPGLVDNHLGKLGKERTVQNNDVEYIDIEANGEVLVIPSSPSVYVN